MTVSLRICHFINRHTLKTTAFFNRFVTSGAHICPTYKEFFSSPLGKQYPTLSPCCRLPWVITIPLNQSECIFPRNSRVQMILCAMLLWN